METATTLPLVQAEKLGEKLTATEAPMTEVNEDMVIEGGEEDDELLT